MEPSSPYPAGPARPTRARRRCKDFTVRPGRALVPRLRRLLDPRAGAARAAGARHPEGEVRVRQRHRLLEPLPVLHEHVRHAHHPRPRAGDRDRHQGGATRSCSVWVDHRRRRRRCRSAAITSCTCCAATSTCKLLLFNNQIYGLTKGQYSPDVARSARRPSRRRWARSTTRSIRSASRSAPAATFVARTLDVDVQHIQEMLKRAAAHKGTAFVEIYQNCNIFNDGAFAQLHRQGQQGRQRARARARQAAALRQEQGKGHRARQPGPARRWSTSTRSARTSCSSTTRPATLSAAADQPAGTARISPPRSACFAPWSARAMISS